MDIVILYQLSARRLDYVCYETASLYNDDIVGEPGASVIDVNVTTGEPPALLGPSPRLA